MAAHALVVLKGVGRGEEHDLAAQQERGAVADLESLGDVVIGDHDCRARPSNETRETPMPYYAIAALMVRDVTRRRVIGALATDDPAPEPIAAVPTAVALRPQRRRWTRRALDRQSSELGMP